MLTCKEIKILALIGLVLLILINGLLIKGSLSVTLRTLIEYIIFISIAIFYYCKKFKNKNKEE